jgi:hypothetical protein
VLVANVRINLQQEGSIVFVSEPPRNRANVDSGFHARRSEEVTEGMGREPLNAELTAGTVHEALRFLHAEYRAAYLVRSHLFKKLAHLVSHGDESILTVFRDSEMNRPARKIEIGPEDVNRLRFPGAAESDELNEFGGSPAIGHPGGPNRLNELKKLIPRWEAKLPAFGAFPPARLEHPAGRFARYEAPRGIGVEVAQGDRHVEDLTNGVESAFDRCYTGTRRISREFSRRGACTGRLRL